MFQFNRKLIANFLILVLKSQLLLACLNRKMIVSYLLKLFLKFHNLRILETIHPLLFYQLNQRICRNKLGFQIRQRLDTMIFCLVFIGLLITDKRNEES